MCSSWASSIAWISSGPSSVLRFQVNATRSRQKLSSWNSAAAAAVSPAVNALSKSDSHWSTSLTVSPPAGPTEHREYQQGGDADACTHARPAQRVQDAQGAALLPRPADERRHLVRFGRLEAVQQPPVGGDRTRPLALAREVAGDPHVRRGDPVAHVGVGGAVEAGDQVARHRQPLVVALEVAQELGLPRERGGGDRVVVEVALGDLVVERESVV